MNKKRPRRLLALLYSPEGQATCITDQTPCMLSVLGNDPVQEDFLRTCVRT